MNFMGFLGIPSGLSLSALDLRDTGAVHVVSLAHLTRTHKRIARQLLVQSQATAKHTQEIQPRRTHARQSKMFGSDILHEERTNADFRTLPRTSAHFRDSALTHSHSHSLAQAGSNGTKIEI